ncbi:uncharacterized protein LOC143696197 isoform X1 [Agelaius phoeniceus]|uniref:uncharacterized protein LOC143696197 isoform X1 n=1 Tax=Agelaius phoeniceus TaxID=39638 RepID=UPI00405510FA
MNFCIAVLLVLRSLPGKAEVEDDTEEMAPDLFEYMTHLSEKCLFFKSIFTISHEPQQRVGITRAGKGFIGAVQTHLSCTGGNKPGHGGRTQLSPCWTGVPSAHSATSPGAVSISGNYYYSTEDYYYDNTTATPATYVYEFDSYETNITEDLDYEKFLREWNATSEVSGLPDTNAPGDAKDTPGDAKDTQDFQESLGSSLQGHLTLIILLSFLALLL